jgi:hypothetical protein
MPITTRHAARRVLRESVRRETARISAEVLIAGVEMRPASLRKLAEDLTEVAACLTLWCRLVPANGRGGERHDVD